MSLETHDFVNDFRWNQYRSLELVPRYVPIPHSHRNPFKSGLNVVWRSLLTLLIDELVEEQRVEYLNRCWSLNVFGEGEQSPSNPLHRLWVLME